jgi:hypothetical protein
MGAAEASGRWYGPKLSRDREYSGRADGTGLGTSESVEWAQLTLHLEIIVWTCHATVCLCRSSFLT